MTINYTCTNIEWDTDGDDSILRDLPKALTFAVDSEIANNEDELTDHLSDRLSDETGWCHFGFDFSPEVVN